MWQRHTGDSKFHAGSPEGGSWRTLCSGRWALTDEADGRVEVHEDPPAAERCRLCELRAELAAVRKRLEDKEHELYLVERELAHVTAPTGADAQIAKLENALLEAVELVLRIGRRGLMTPNEHARAGELMRLVPQ